MASATSICDKVDKSVRFLVTLLKKDDRNHGHTIGTGRSGAGQTYKFFRKKMLDEFILCSHSFSAVKHVLESIWHHINVKRHIFRNWVYFKQRNTFYMLVVD